MRLFPCTVEETVRTAIARISSISVSENVVFWCTVVPKCPRRQQIPVLLAWLHICSLWAARQFFIWAPFFWSDAAASICAGNQHLRRTEFCNKLTNTNASLATLVTESIWWEFDKFSLEYHRKHTGNIYTAFTRYRQYDLCRRHVTEKSLETAGKNNQR